MTLSSSTLASANSPHGDTRSRPESGATASPYSGMWSAIASTARIRFGWRIDGFTGTSSRGAESPFRTRTESPWPWWSMSVDGGVSPLRSRYSKTRPGGTCSRSTGTEPSAPHKYPRHLWTWPSSRPSRGHSHRNRCISPARASSPRNIPVNPSHLVCKEVEINHFIRDGGDQKMLLPVLALLLNRP